MLSRIGAISFNGGSLPIVKFRDVVHDETSSVTKQIADKKSFLFMIGEFWLQI